MKNKQKSAALSHEFENFLSEMEDLLRETASLGGEELAVAKEKIQQRVAEAKATASSISGDLARRARKAARRADVEVHEEPWKIVGAGALVGLLLGILLARR